MEKIIHICTGCGIEMPYNIYKGLCSKCHVKTEIKEGRFKPTSSNSNKKIIVYYKFNSTSIELCFDDDEERGCPKTTGSNTVEIKHFPHEDIQKAFDYEDGDGDDCGSWSRNIIMIVDEKNNMLWYPQSVWNKLKTRYQKAENSELSKMYDEMLEHMKCNVKAGVF